MFKWGDGKSNNDSNLLIMSRIRYMEVFHIKLYFISSRQMHCQVENAVCDFHPPLPR